LLTFIFLLFQIKVGKNVVVPAYSKVSLLEKPSNEDSDEELEYADTNSGVTDSPRKFADPKVSIYCIYEYFHFLLMMMQTCNTHVLLGELCFHVAAFSSMRSNADHPTVESEDEDSGASDVLLYFLMQRFFNACLPLPCWLSGFLGTLVIHLSCPDLCCL
jgi:hypothetical protein